MDIKGINSYNNFYSPQSIQRNKSVQPTAEAINNSSIGSNPKELLPEAAKEIPAVSTLNKDEKHYFHETYKNEPQVQTYLGTGKVQEFYPKGQVLDLKG